MKRLALLTATVGATLVGAWLLWQFREVLLLFVLSIGLAAALRPLADRGEASLHWPRAATVLTAYLLTLAFIAVVVFAASPPVIDDLRRAADQFVLTYDKLWSSWPTGSPLQQSLLVWLPPPQELYGTVTGERGAALASSLLGATLSLADLVSRSTIVVVMSIYWSIDQPRLERLWLSLLRAGDRSRATEIWRAMETGLGAYLRSELIQSLLAGLLLGTGYWVLRLPFPALVATVSAFVWFIPWLGAVLGLCLVLLAGMSVGPWVTLGACVYTILIFAVLEFAVEPRLYNRRQFSSLLAVVLVFALWDVAGIFGLLAAPPLAAALQILFRNLATPSVSPLAEPARERFAERFAELEGRVANLDASLGITAQAPAPQVANLVARLGSVVAEARRALAREGALPAKATGGEPH